MDNNRSSLLQISFELSLVAVILMAVIVGFVVVGSYSLITLDRNVREFQRVTATSASLKTSVKSRTLSDQDTE